MDRATGGASRRSPTDELPPAPQFSSDSAPAEDDQLARSRALQNEGIEGLIPRASELLKLGLSSFLTFGPLIGRGSAE